MFEDNDIPAIQIYINKYLPQHAHNESISEGDAQIEPYHEWLIDIPLLSKKNHNQET